MFLLPRHLQKLFQKKKGKDRRTFAEQVETVETIEGTQADFEIYPEDISVRKRWFSLTVREREVVALVCMGYRNYEIASMLGIGYGTVQTHLQNIFYKFHLRSKNEVRAALKSWPAEEWWRRHH